MSPDSDFEALYNDLLQFLYRTPWGLIQTDRSGAVQMLNPVAAKILMQVTDNGRLDNLFRIFKDVRPELESLTRQFEERYGVVCEDLPLRLARGGDLTLSVFVQNESCLMVVLRELKLQGLTAEKMAACEKYTALIEHPLIGVLTTRQNTIQHANAAAQRMLGLPAALEGESLENLLPGGEWQALVEEALPMLLAVQHYETTCTLTVRGEARQFSINALPPGGWDDQTQWVLLEQGASPLTH